MVICHHPFAERQKHQPVSEEIMKQIKFKSKYNLNCAIFLCFIDAQSFRGAFHA